MPDPHEPRRKVFVLALAGMSPAVVTELLWHLVTQQRRHVCWLEIWTTADRLGKAGFRALSDHLPRFHALREHLGADAAFLPGFPEELTHVHETDEAAAFRVVVPRRSRGDDVDDIVSNDDAELYSAALHDRVRALRAVLTRDVELIGALAGGRKTMSAALQTAFCLQARAPARLVHLLVHPKIEADREEFRAFAFPRGPLLDIEEAKQLVVYDVPFLPLRELEVAVSLDDVSYHGLRERMRQVALGEPTARIVKEACRYWIEVYRGGTRVGGVELTEEYLSVICRVREGEDGVSLQDLHASIGTKRQVESTSKWLDNQRRRLVTCCPALDGFLPARGTSREKRYRIERREDLAWPPVVSETPVAAPAASSRTTRTTRGSQG